MKEIDLFVKILVFVKEGGILILRSAIASTSHLKIEGQAHEFWPIRIYIN
jgi:hypothetical protein